MQIDGNVWLVWLADGGRSRPFFIRLDGTDEEINRFLEFFNAYRDVVGDHPYDIEDRTYVKKMLEDAHMLFSNARNGGGVSLEIMGDFERVIE